MKTLIFLYRNKLKNREFGQKAPQIFDSERVTIAERQGTSEDQKGGVKPTQPKTDSSGCFGIYRNKLKNREFGQKAPQIFDSERVIIAERQGTSEDQKGGVKPTQPKTDSSGCFGIYRNWSKSWNLARRLRKLFRLETAKQTSPNFNFLIYSSMLLAASAPLAATLPESHSQFAFSLYSQVEETDNLVFSPYSISTCLSMVYLGARGDTEAQMQQALHLDADRKNIAKSSQALLQSLLPVNGNDPSYTLNIANAVWVNPDTFLLADFRYAVQQQFKAHLAKVNFAVPGDAIKTINDWTSEKTEGRIPQLLSADDIDASTRLVLTNAVYFQGGWTVPFDAKTTQDWPFHPTSETSVTVKMMHQTTSLPYYENDLLQVAALPFRGKTNDGGNLAFVILLPKSAENFSAVVSELPRVMDEWIKSLSPQKIELKLPKFTIDTRLPLNVPLKQLGMEDAFDANANFVGIDGMRDLFLNKVVHQSFFALDENGVTAAAATAASMNMTATAEKKLPVPLIADHPFLFFIIDLKSQEMLFMGKVSQPNIE